MQARPDAAHKRILVLFAHPAFEKSLANRALCDAIRDLEAITFRDLYEIYPRFDIDVREEQRLLLEHDVIVLQHPFFWYSCPALLKEWLDLVLEFNFAYGPRGTALQGKWMMNAITTGGSHDAYSRAGANRFTIPELLSPFDQTAHLCGLRYLPPFVVYGSLSKTRDFTGCAAAFRKALETIARGEVPHFDPTSSNCDFCLSTLWGQSPEREVR